MSNKTNKIEDLTEELNSEINTLKSKSSTIESEISSLGTTIENKVDKITGKNLSTNDFTDEDLYNLSDNKYELDTLIGDLFHKDYLRYTNTEIGKSVSVNGNLINNANYTATDFIPLSETKRYRCFTAGAEWQTAQYDKNKNFVSYAGKGGNWSYINNPTTKFIRISMLTSVWDKCQFNEWNPIILKYPTLNPKVPISSTAIDIPTVITVGASKDYTSLRTALESITDTSIYKRYRVEFYGDGTEYDIAGDFTSYTGNGLTIPAYTTLVGIGGKEKCILTADLSDKLEKASTTFSTLCLKTSSNLEGFTVKGINTRNVIHQDFNGGLNEHSYIKNCDFIGTNMGKSHVYAGGLWSGCSYHFDNCTFKNETENQYVFSCHNNVGFVRPGNIYLNDCTFISNPNTNINDYYTFGLGSLNTSNSNGTIISANGINCNCYLNGCAINGKLLLREEDVISYGAGILWKVYGYANSIVKIAISSTDGEDYSNNIQLNSSLSLKADKVENAVSGNFASLNNSGNLVDSGYKPSDFGTYSKPSGGIPKTDLAQSVQDSLGLADTAIQSLSGYATETYVNNHHDSTKEDVANKVTSISSNSTDTQYPTAKCVYDNLTNKQDKITSTNKLSYTLLSDTPTIPTVTVDPEDHVYLIDGNPIAAQYDDDLNDISLTYEKLSNKVTSLSSSSTDTEYPSAKCVYDNLANKQDTLISGTNIKTINNNSLLGSGNISISGGSEPYELIEKVIIGYALTEKKPDDWSTNYIDYFTNTGTLVDPTYTPVPAAGTAPEWQSKTYYSKDTTGSSIDREYSSLGISFQKLFILITNNSLTSGNYILTGGNRPNTLTIFYQYFGIANAASKYSYIRYEALSPNIFEIETQSSLKKNLSSTSTVGKYCSIFDYNNNPLGPYADKINRFSLSVQGGDLPVDTVVYIFGVTN